MRAVPSAVSSPCTGICRIDSASGLCLGCRRTLEEIADWPMLTGKEKRAVLKTLEGRAEASPSVSSKPAQ